LKDRALSICTSLMGRNL